MKRSKGKGRGRAGGQKPRANGPATLTTFGGEPSTMRAIVTKVCRGVPGGDYAVCLPEDDSVLAKHTSVTFSLKSWGGDKEPQEGQVAVLSDITEHSGGWRAASAKPIKPQSRRRSAGGARGRS